MKEITLAEVVAMLKAKQGDISLRQFAHQLELSAPYLSDVYRGNRQPGKKLLAWLGLAKKSATTVTYFKKGKK